MAFSQFEISEPPIAEKRGVIHNDEFLGDLNAFNAESLAISAAVEELRPESVAFSEMGLKLQAVLDSGIERLSEDNLQIFLTNLTDASRWMGEFRVRYDALMDKVAAQEKRRVELEAKAKQLGIVIDFPNVRAN